MLILKASSRPIYASCTRSAASLVDRYLHHPPAVRAGDLPIRRALSFVHGQQHSSAFGCPKMHVKRRTRAVRVHPFSNRVRKVAANPAPKNVPISEPVGVRPIKPKTLSAHDSNRRDPGRVVDIIRTDPSIDTRTPARIPTQTLLTPTMPFPTSPQSLYRSLLFITSNPPFSIRTAIDYYFDWPKALHSTKSFNFLISLALRSASFASVVRLFSVMRAESIPTNMETWKLHVRWLIRTGRWNDAWKRVLEIAKQQGVATTSSINPIPLPLWLELFGTQKRGASRHWVITDWKPIVKASLAARNAFISEVVLGPGCDVSRDARLHASLEDGQKPRLDADVRELENVTPLLRKRLVPRSCPSSYSIELSRYRALLQVSPLLAPPGQVQILPRSILIITRAMYQVGQSSLALSTALSYVKSLPPHLRRCDRRGVLDLVNFHLSMVTRHKKPSLKQHFTQRRILWRFLHARPDLTPSSMTLFLLLGPLRNCHRSGTLAMQCFRLFEKRWGPCVQSRLVRRRVASLALKEGRLDIVNTMMALEWRWRASDDTLLRKVHISARMPWRTLFSRRGAENQRWHLIEEKYRRRSMMGSEL